MSGAAFFRLKKLTGSGIMLKASRHNKREIQAEQGASGSIDATRSNSNIVLMGPAAACEVAQSAKTKIMLAGINKIRKNAVVGVELVFSLPPDHKVDEIAYFTACAKWAGASFGGEANIVSVDIHFDEAQTHAHVLLVPLLEGHLRGSDAVGNKRKLSELQGSFFKEVASIFGFNKPRTRLSGSTKTQTVRQILERLRNDPAAKSAAWSVIRDSVELNPVAYALALGIKINTHEKQPRTLAQIFTSRGKGTAAEIPIGFQSKKPIGFQIQTPNNVSAQKKEQPLGLCRESDPTTQIKTSPPPPTEHQEHAEHQVIRVRDEDFSPENFDSETGEFFKPSHPQASGRDKANRWVRQQLQFRQKD